MMSSGAIRSSSIRLEMACFDVAWARGAALARHVQAVAPTLDGLGLARRLLAHGGQDPDAGGLGRLGGVQAKSWESALFMRLSHHAVEGVDHPGCVAAGVVAGEQGAIKGLDHEALRRLEYPWVSAPEAVDALLGVAHQKDLDRLAPAQAPARAGVSRQPRLQGLPLQRAGVLELVHQQLANLAVQALLDPAREFLVTQEPSGCQLQIDHVGLPTLGLELRVLAEQDP